MITKDKKHYAWMDMLKGIGILSVMTVHITDYKNLFVYALPLFFILSGYLYRQQPLGKYTIKMYKRLIVPYCCFYVLLSVCNLKILHLGIIRKFLLGGNALVGDYGVFWYIGVLFASLIIINIIQRFRIKNWIFAPCFLLAMLINKSDLYLPWNIQAIPLVLCYLGSGMLLRHYFCPDKVCDIGKRNSLLIISLLVIPLIYFASAYFLDIKYNDYGIPLLSFMLSILIVLGLSIISTRLQSRVIIRPALSYLGKSSLFLMFVHQFIHFRLLFIDNVWLQLLITITLSVFLYSFIYNFKICRILLCGENK